MIDVFEPNLLGSRLSSIEHEKKKKKYTFS